MMKTTTKNFLRRAIMLLMVLVSFANVVKAENFTFNMTDNHESKPYKIVVSINDKCVVKIYQANGQLYKTMTFRFGQRFGYNSDGVVSFSNKEVAEWEDFLNLSYNDGYIAFGSFTPLVTIGTISKVDYYCFAKLWDDIGFYFETGFNPVDRKTYIKTYLEMERVVSHRATRSSSGKYTFTAKFAGGSTSKSSVSGTRQRSMTKPKTSTTSTPAQKAKSAPTASQFVDLGLSVKWATCNLGASSPEQYGNYYAWGETTKKTTYSWDTYKYGKWSDAITKYCQDKAYGKNGYTDRRTTLEVVDDAARIRLGSPWRMPTAIEIWELVERCTWTRATIGGKSGYKVVGPNGNSIFLPAGGRYFKTTHGNIGEGYYWSSTLGDYPTDAQYLDFDSTGPHRRDAGIRIHGMLIRPVRP